MKIIATQKVYFQMEGSKFNTPEKAQELFLDSPQYKEIGEKYFDKVIGVQLLDIGWNMTDYRDCKHTAFFDVHVYDYTTENIFDKD